MITPVVLSGGSGTRLWSLSRKLHPKQLLPSDHVINNVEPFHSDHYQAKCITVTPGAMLSLQLHHHRAEHWIMVSGSAKVTKDEGVFTRVKNESVFIPFGTKHRLENIEDIPLELIEIQTGNYLGEDDKVCFDDVYGRGI